MVRRLRQFAVLVVLLSALGSAAAQTTSTTGTATGTSTATVTSTQTGTSTSTESGTATVTSEELTTDTQTAACAEGQVLSLRDFAQGLSTDGSTGTTSGISSGGGGGGGGSTWTTTQTTSTVPPTRAPRGASSLLVSAGSQDVVTMIAGTTRTIPIQVAARGSAVMGVHLVLVSNTAILATPDTLVRTLTPGNDATFYLTLHSVCPQGGMALVEVQAVGRGAASSIETIQVVIHGSAAGASIAWPSMGLLGVGLLAATIAVRRRLA